ncbi:MAG: RpiB/LacA/LacB family sugar-phosphate isomerase [Verrucomicrobia bacterium]|nr:RpiB/LacA/LacB family sugar-phosphate isomerase [Verrucomicrobiota bacterium]
MRIAIGSVVKGFKLKEALKAHLQSRGHAVIEVGCPDTAQFCKFPSVGERIARALNSGEAELAINCCGSGTGASISAGKFKGVCAVSCESEKTARLARVVNDANCLCMGEDVVTPELACKMADAFVEAHFQDAPAAPEEVRAFWREARDELMAHGADPGARELEFLKKP